MSIVKIGKNFANVGGGTGSSVVQIVAPATNTQGVIIRTLGLVTGASSSVSQAMVYADTTAPTTPADATKRMIAILRSIGTNYFTSTTIPYEIEVPAGLGIWVGMLDGAGAYMTWDLVQV